VLNIFDRFSLNLDFYDILVVSQTSPINMWK